MSLSSNRNKARGGWGTIYSQGREHSLGSMEQGQGASWSAEDEAAYLERVRERAGQMATKLITDARREAESIKAEAREEGYALGMEDARNELEEFRAGMGEAVASVLGAIEGQCSSIFDQWRDDLIALVRLSVEKITGMELSENRRAILDALLSESVAVLEQRKELVIRVNPEDEPMLADIVGLARERFPDVHSWRVKGDGGISPGGMVVESESSLAEGRLESRVAAVEAVLSGLVLTDGTLPEEPGRGATLSPASGPVAEREAAKTAWEPSPEAAVPAGRKALLPETLDNGSGQEQERGLPLSSEVAPGLDLANPNLSQEEVEAALEAMLSSESGVSES